jgi:hypothetical protein
MVSATRALFQHSNTPLHALSRTLTPALPVIIAAADRLDSGCLFDEVGDLGEIAGEVIVGPQTRGSQPPEAGPARP